MLLRRERSESFFIYLSAPLCVRPHGINIGFLAQPFGLKFSSLRDLLGHLPLQGVRSNRSALPALVSRTYETVLLRPNERIPDRRPIRIQSQLDLHREGRRQDDGPTLFSVVVCVSL